MVRVLSLPGSFFKMARARIWAAQNDGRPVIAAGKPLEAVQTSEAISVPIDMVRDSNNSYVLRVQGDSMIDEQIRSGDYVIVEQTDTAYDGQIVVALLGGGHHGPLRQQARRRHGRIAGG